MTSLLIGCGNSREKRIRIPGKEEWSLPLVTMDMDPDCGADIVHDIEQRPLPFASDSFDEMGAFDVLEHVGKQGDWRGWFDEMAEYWRILKPGGWFYIIVPVGAAAFYDPGHTRFFSKMHFGFLNQRFYEEQRRLKTTATDYRHYWRLNFEIRLTQEETDLLGVILEKPQA